ncbi:glycosyl hydrolase [Paenibacillus sp. 2TAB23]|uniref:glycosyl hydrolase n=1 Tax=Paenibacillus sp. 2TAB23 TaxID=3233004 RepID=UPI003F9AC101
MLHHLYRLMSSRRAIHLVLSFLLILSLTAVLPARNSAYAAAAPANAIDSTSLTANHPFGPNVRIMDPSMSQAEIQNVADSIFTAQERGEFSAERHAILFKPGIYDQVNVKVGFYTQVSGLGQNPDDVDIRGSVNTNADWNNGNALINFWRSAENFSVTPPTGSSAQWAVAQAAPMRRVHVKGQLELFDFDSSWNAGYASGGFLADTKVDGGIVPASQQQWFSRNNQYGSWSNGVWNMVFVGDQQPPSGEFPASPYTVVEKSPLIREKPYLYIDNAGNYQVFVPSLQKDAKGISWLNGPTPGKSIPIEQFYIAMPESASAATINEALEQGKHVLFTPGIYHLSDTIHVTKPDTVVMGLGFATLIPDNGQKVMTTADAAGIIIASLLFDAGEKVSPVLLEVGPNGSELDHSSNPSSLHDLFFRVGGAHAGTTDNNLEINSNHVIGDHFWIWRADHGASAGGWATNDSLNGLIVNGDNVTIYGLFNEHHNEYQTIWNGEGGRLYFYQSEIPYEVPDQASWMSKGGTVNGYASYKVADSVKTHEAWGLGVYSYFRDANVKAHSAIEVPDVPGVNIHHATSIFLAGNGEITHVINQTGSAATLSSVRQTVSEYGGKEAGEVEVVLDRSGWTASAYKATGSDAAPANAIDGNASSRWANQEAQNPSGSQWFQVDMGKTEAFDTVRMESGGDYARSYQVLISNDGTSWTEVAAGTGSAASAATFEKQAARYLRIVQTGTAASNWWSLNELNVSVKQPAAAVSKVAITPGTLNLKQRQSAWLTAVVTPAEATNKSVSWSSSDPFVATVDLTGKVTALNVGSAIITVKTIDGEKTAQASITVSEGEQLPQPIANKKGAAAIKYLSAEPSKLSDLGIGWAYNWSIDYTGDALAMDYVPMLWGPGAVTDETIDKLKEGKAEGRYDSLLGYNEPELVQQSNTSVIDTIKDWPRLMETGLRLGSPAVAYTYDNSYAAGKDWLKQFMEQIEDRHYPVDFITLHFYPDFTDPNAVSKLKSTLEALYNEYEKPIWITEIGAIPFGTTYQTPSEALAVKFLKELVPMLEGLPFVERYAWFGDNCAHDQGCAYTTLYDMEDSLTPIGHAFKNPFSVPDPERDEKLVRTGWSASASSTAFGTLPQFVFDGDTGRQWSTEAGQTGGEWFLLDLGDAQLVSGLELDAGAGAPYDYARGFLIQLSLDGINWSKAAEGAGGSQVLKQSWSPQTARYVKITQTSHDGFWRWSINELNVFGPVKQLVQSISVNGEGQSAAIAVKNGTLQMSAAIWPAQADEKAVEWHVFNLEGEETETASISEDGMLAAHKDGQVMVVAAAKDGSGITGELIVSISGQADIKPDSTISGPDYVYPGQTLTIALGINEMPTRFTTMQMVMQYDPAALSFDTVTNEDGSLSLAESAIQPSAEHFMVLGTAVKEEAGQILFILASRDNGGYTGNRGDLLSLHLQIATTASAGETQLTLSDVVLSYEGLSTNAADSRLVLPIVIADKAALAAAIDEAQSRLDAAVEGSQAGQYPIGSKSKLFVIINEAVSVKVNAGSTEIEVADALSKLNEATQAFMSSVNPSVPVITDKTALDEAIDKAKLSLSAAKPGDKIGQYPAASIAALEQAVQHAQIVRNNPYASQSQVDAEVNGLQASVQNFAGTLVSLVRGAARITINDLSIIAKYYGVRSSDPDWQVVQAADLFNKGEIDIQVLAAVAKMIISEWLHA